MNEVTVEEKYIKFADMAGVAHIEAIRSYLDYMEEHLFNVRRAFEELTDACNGKFAWVGDDYSWWSFREEVINHDISKFSHDEFIPYVRAFFPVEGEERQPLGDAWEHHKEHNHHHWESVENYTDVVHMVIDWMAMGYKFNSTPREYYENNRERIKLDEDKLAFMHELFDAIDGGV